RILLGAVEAVNLVDEQQRALPGLTAQPRRVEHFLEIGDAGEDRGNLLEIKIRRPRQKPRHRGLAGARRPPEDQRAERARLQHAGERAVGAEQMVLADDVAELVRTQLVGKRPRRFAVETACREETGTLWFRTRGHLFRYPSPHLSTQRGERGLSAEHHRNLLAAALAGDATLPAIAAGDALQIVRLYDLLVVRRHDDIAFLETHRLR